MIQLDICKTSNESQSTIIYPSSNPVLIAFSPLVSFSLTHTRTTDDEVGVEDAQGGLVGILLIVYGCGDDQAKRDARHTLQDDQSYDQHQRTLVRNLEAVKKREREKDRESKRLKQRESKR